LPDSTGLNFGVYDPLATSDYTAATSFGIKCSKNAAYTVGLSAGNGVGATDTARTLANGSEAVMNYAIYSDSARTKNWGVSTNAATGSGLSTLASNQSTTAAIVLANTRRSTLESCRRLLSLE